MKDIFKETFDNIHATDLLVNTTKTRVLNKMVQPKHTYGHAKLILGLTMVLLVCGLGYWLWFIPVVTISVDINPSIELSINRLDRVIDVVAYNNDGQTIIDTLDLKYETYTQALNELMDDELIFNIMNDGGLANITVVGNDSNHCQHMVDTINTTVNTGGTMMTYHGSTRALSNAHHHGMSYGRYGLYQLLIEYGVDITIDQINDMSMVEIMDLLEQGGYDGSTNISNGQGHHGYGHHQ